MRLVSLRPRCQDDLGAAIQRMEVIVLALLGVICLLKIPVGPDVVVEALGLDSHELVATAKRVRRLFESNLMQQQIL